MARTSLQTVNHIGKKVALGWVYEYRLPLRKKHVILRTISVHFCHVLDSSFTITCFLNTPFLDCSTEIYIHHLQLYHVPVFGPPHRHAYWI